MIDHLDIEASGRPRLTKTRTIGRTYAFIIGAVLCVVLIGISSSDWGFPREELPFGEIARARGRTATGVKFYLYSDLDWMSMTCNDGVLVDELVKPQRDGFPFKHTDDYWFLKAALHHPWRVSDPEEADLFVVPALLNFPMEQISFSRRQCCVGDLCNAELFRYTDTMLAQSPWFKRYGGKDHVAVCSHYGCPGQLALWRNIQACNTISFEENSMRGDRCRIATTYVGRACVGAPSEHGNSTAIARQDTFVMVASMHPERPSFRQRGEFCEWAKSASRVGPYNVSQCGPGPQCPAVAQAQFGFHIRGDTLGSNRLMDYILSGTVPVFTDERQYDILLPFVPWRNLSVLINARDKDEFLDAVGRVVPQYETVKATLDFFAPLLRWETPAPFEQYMQLFQFCSPRHK